MFLYRLLNGPAAPAASMRSTVYDYSSTVKNPKAFDREDHVSIEIPCPGINRDGIEVTVNESSLAVEAQHPEEERNVSFRTNFNPQDYYAEEASASMNNGLLKIDLPKRTGERGTNRIPIK